MAISTQAMDLQKDLNESQQVSPGTENELSHFPKAPGFPGSESEPKLDGNKTPPTIKHLVLAGGGTSGLVAFGALKATEQNGIWSKKDIVSIDAVSAGGIMAVIVALKYDWAEVETYIVKRPWHHVIKSDIYSILGAFVNRGIWTVEVMEQILWPLLLAKNLAKTATLQDLYDATQVDVHFYTVDMKEKCDLVDVSYKTHPEWLVVEAVYASSCVPVLFAPLFRDGIGYVDGGMLLNYPLAPCLQRNTVDPDAVFGIDKTYEPLAPPGNDASSNLLDHVFFLMNQLIRMSWQRKQAVKKIAYEMNVTSQVVQSMDILRLCSSEELRQKLVDEGAALAASTLFSQVVGRRPECRLQNSSSCSP